MIGGRRSRGREKRGKRSRNRIRAIDFFKKTAITIGARKLRGRIIRRGNRNGAIALIAIVKLRRIMRGGCGRSIGSHCCRRRGEREKMEEDENGGGGKRLALAFFPNGC